MIPARYAVIALLMIVYMLGLAWSASFQDTARDVFEAFGIRHGLRYPLEGPILGDAVHLGPVWYYLLALPLWLHDSWLSSALFAGFMGSLKFPLAYHCGSRLVDRDFGLFWAIALALPGWQNLEQLVFFNPNPAAAALLLVLALTLHAIKPMPRRGTFVALGLALALGLHVHPTTAPAIPIALFWVWRSSESSDRATRLMAILVGFALPFVPYVAHQAASGWPDWKGAAGYVERRIALANLIGWPGIVAGVVWGGPEVIGRYVSGWPPLMVVSLCGALAILISASPFAPSARRLVVPTVAAFLAFSVWVALLRPVTHFYFVFVLPPILAALAAVTLWVGWNRPRVRPWIVGALAAILVLDLVVARDMALKVRSGEGVLPARVVDIKDWSYAQTFNDVWFPAIARQRLGAALCGAQAGMTLHGQLAYLVDRSLGVDALFSCSRRDHIMLANGDPVSGEHMVGLTRRFWSALDAVPDCWIGSMGVARARPVGRPDSLRIADGSIYPPRLASRSRLQELELEFDAPRSHAVVVSNATPGYQVLSVERVTVDGAELRSSASDDVASAYAPPPGRDPARWHVWIRANEVSATDVVSVERSPERSRSPACR